MPDTTLEVVISDDIRECDRLQQWIVTLGTGDFSSKFVFGICEGSSFIDVGHSIVGHLLGQEGLFLVVRQIVQLDSLVQLLSHSDAHECRLLQVAQITQCVIEL